MGRYCHRIIAVHACQAVDHNYHTLQQRNHLPGMAFGSLHLYSCWAESLLKQDQLTVRTPPSHSILAFDHHLVLGPHRYLQKYLLRLLLPLPHHLRFQVDRSQPRLAPHPVTQQLCIFEFSGLIHKCIN